MDSNEVVKGQVLYGTLKRGQIAQADSTNAVTVWAPASGKQIRLANYQIEVSGQCIIAASAAVNLTLQTTSLVVAVHTTRIQTGVLTTAGLWGLFERDFPGGLLLPRGETLTLTSGTALGAGGGTIACHCYGREE